MSGVQETNKHADLIADTVFLNFINFPLFAVYKCLKTCPDGRYYFSNTIIPFYEGVCLC